MSVAGWNYQALKAAKGAHLEVEGLEAAVKKSVAFLEGVAKLSNSGDSFSYSQSTGPRNNWTMRAVGTLCLQLLDKGNSPDLKDELEKISTTDLAQFHWDKAPKNSLYG